MFRKKSIVRAYATAAIVTSILIGSGRQASGSCLSQQAGLISPTKVGATHIRKGFGEYGAPRERNSHVGVDLVLRLSSTDNSDYEVRAVAPGTVAYAQQNGSADAGYGNIVVIDHGSGCYTMYAHLSNKPFTPSSPGANLEVKIGDNVAAGQVIGYMRDLKADVDGSGNAVKLAPPFRIQVHFALVHAEEGRRGPGLLKSSILKDPSEIENPTQLLLNLGYAVE